MSNSFNRLYNFIYDSKKTDNNSKKEDKKRLNCNA